MNYPIMNNRPVKLYWAGWESDTYKLGCEGWEISAQQDVYNRQMRIAINHPKAEIRGMTEIDAFHYQELMNPNYTGGTPTLPTMLHFEDIARQIYVQHMMSRDVAFHPVDFRPQYSEVEIQSLNDFANFAPLELPKNEIFLREANINQILAMALEKQAPDQERIRKEMIQRDAIRKMKMGNLHTELRLVA